MRLAYTVLLMACAVTSATSARDLHTFTGNGNDGLTPNGPMSVDANGNLFGTTFNGGDGCGDSCGVVFETAKQNGRWITSTIYAFKGKADGGNPSSPLTVASDGTVYGSAMGSSRGPGGNVFALTPPRQQGGAWTFKNLYVFQGRQDGSLGYNGSNLLLIGGSLFGFTQTGGTSNRCTGGCGTLFELSPPAQHGAWTLQTLFSFPGGAGGGIPDWLSGPDASGVLYVTTAAGDGAVVALAPPSQGGAWTETVLYQFQGGRDGIGPSDLVLGPSGVLYGTSSAPRYSHGYVFQLTPPATPGHAWVKSILHDFTTRESNPSSLAPGKDGALVGVSFGEIDFSPGHVWSLVPQHGGGWAYHQVSRRDLPSRNPENVVLGFGGHLYGVMNGGDSDYGAVFEAP